MGKLSENENFIANSIAYLLTQTQVIVFFAFFKFDIFNDVNIQQLSW